MQIMQQHNRKNGSATVILSATVTKYPSRYRGGIGVKGNI